MLVHPIVMSTFHWCNGFYNDMFFKNVFKNANDILYHLPITVTEYCTVKSMELFDCIKIDQIHR